MSIQKTNFGHLVVLGAIMLWTQGASAQKPAEMVCLTASPQSNDQLLYFTSTSLLSDDQHLIFLSDRTGCPNIFIRDVATGTERQLTRNTEGFLKSYVYFDGVPYRGLGRASVSVDPQRGMIYYLQGRQVCAVDTNGTSRVLTELPADQMTAFTHVSGDGKRLCVPTTDARALDGDTLLKGKPKYNIDARVQQENLSSYLRVYDTSTGKELLCERVPKSWITHVQFSPRDPNLILYNHEWPSDCGIRRMWLWDGQRHIRLRTEGDGRKREDWTCHEMWERDGSAIIYHGGYAKGPSYLGRVNPDGSGLVEIALPKEWNRYGHFTVGRPGWLVSDGCYTQAGDPKGSGAWISALNVDWSTKKYEWQPLCRSGSSWKSQDAHPHPIFNHAANAALFTSDKDGKRAVYKIAVPATLKHPLPLRGLQEVNHGQVEMRGGFWGPRLKTHHQVTLPHALNQLEKDGHVTNFDKAAGVTNGPVSGHHAFDSDLYKALEGAVDSLQHNNDPAFRQRVDNIIDRILAAQQKDGFLITCHILNGLDKRWDDLRLGHQMYNAGHFFEMAVEHQHLTGDPKALDAAKRFADHIDSVFGPNKRYDVDGHQEVELALVRLYRATGEQRYLELARFFLDERGYVHGTEHKLFDPKTAVAPVKPEGALTKEQRREFWHAQLRLRNGRMQDHKPVIDQFEAVGHAVRAGYMYSAMADMVRFSEAPGYEKALDHLWTDVVSRKMYLTGGIGTAQYGDEGFGDPYLLPNESAYCESCAAIAHVFWQHRMALLKGQAKYADVMELALYNGVLSGISLSGDQFFYENPLSSKGGQSRRPWIGLSCCPSNLARLIPQVGGLAYGVGDDQAVVNLYVEGEVSLKLNNGANIKLVQQTQYPWEGRVGLTVSPEKALTFDLSLRIPGWARGCPVPSDLYRFAESKKLQINLNINGKSIDATPREDGYVHIKREWKSGDRVELDLPMPIQRIYAHDNVKENQGKVALMRGPIIYCIEAIDNLGVDLFSLVLPPKAELHAEHRVALLGGVTVLKGEAFAEGNRPVSLMAVPSYAWANREKGAMTVWISEPQKK